MKQPNPIAKHMADWEADAIEKCRNDPRIAELGLCYICMTSLPDCLCVTRRARGEIKFNRKKAIAACLLCWPIAIPLMWWAYASPLEAALFVGLVVSIIAGNILWAYDDRRSE